MLYNEDPEETFKVNYLYSCVLMIIILFVLVFLLEILAFKLQLVILGGSTFYLPVLPILKLHMNITQADIKE